MDWLRLTSFVIRRVATEGKRGRKRAVATLLLKVLLGNRNHQFQDSLSFDLGKDTPLSSFLSTLS